jgi:hypothetical protein
VIKQTSYKNALVQIYKKQWDMHILLTNLLSELILHIGDDIIHPGLGDESGKGGTTVVITPVETFY